MINELSPATLELAEKCKPKRSEFDLRLTPKSAIKRCRLNIIGPVTFLGLVIYYNESKTFTIWFGERCGLVNTK